MKVAPHSSSTPDHRLTLLPLDADNEGDLAINGVVGDQARGSGNGGAEKDGRVNVERDWSTAWRPNDRGECDVALDLVVLRQWAVEGS